MLGLDYSAARIPGQAIKDAGYAFVMRYLWFPGQQHAYLTAEEARDLRAAGISIGPIFESTANRAAQGYGAGVVDARTAIDQLAKVGAPPDCAIYFTVDFDASEGVQGAINDYFRGAASVVGADRVAAYAGYWPLKRLFDAGLIKYGWQTVAWSGMNLDQRRTALFQSGEQDSVAGVECDVNELYSPAGLWGQEGGETMSFKQVLTGDNGYEATAEEFIVGIMRRVEALVDRPAVAPVAITDEQLTAALRPLLPEITEAVRAGINGAQITTQVGGAEA